MKKPVVLSLVPVVLVSSAAVMSIYGPEAPPAWPPEGIATC